MEIAANDMMCLRPPLSYLNQQSNKEIDHAFLVSGLMGRCPDQAKIKGGNGLACVYFSDVVRLSDMKNDESPLFDQLRLSH